MNLKAKNIQQLIAQRRAKKIETVRNEVITVNLKDARAKLAESTGTKQVDSPTTPTSVAQEAVESAEFEKASHYSRQDFLERMNGAPVTDTPIEKSEATPQAPAPDTASVSPVGEDTPASAPVDADEPSCTDSESVDAPTPPTDVDAPAVPVKKPTKSRSRSKSKTKK